MRCMSGEMASLEQAQVLVSLSRLKGVDNRRALDLFVSASGRLEHEGARDIFTSLSEQWTGSSSGHEWAWDESKRRLQQTQDAGVRIVPYFGDDYPERLRHIRNPPVVLFVRGKTEALHALHNIAIVGTREPTEFGLRAATLAGRLAAESGVAVVSGLALGCDTKAHEGCVEADGVAIAVMANGLDRVYPAANRDLADRIVDRGGCLVSENTVGTKLSRWAFAYRDRIQSGLADRVLVIETDVKGGTMHTVNFSRQQGRPLGCINHPGQFLTASKTRGNQMLIAEGAATGIADREELGRFILGVSLCDVALSSQGKERKEFLALDQKPSMNAAAETNVELPLNSGAMEDEPEFNAGPGSERPALSFSPSVGDPPVAQTVSSASNPTTAPCSGTDGRAKEEQLPMALGEMEC